MKSTSHFNLKPFYETLRPEPSTKALNPEPKVGYNRELSVNPARSLIEQPLWIPLKEP